jgi:imidazoleglycerol-phosphate dehydratase
LGAAKIGDFDTELIQECLRAFATNGSLTLHVRQLSGANAHHIAEATFKGLGLALRDAVALDPRQPSIPSTKGSLL